MTPNFSIVLIARNEALTLPRLVKSLEEFQKRNGEIILIDTGSTDDTPKIAKDLGCLVTEVGDRFLTTIQKGLAEKINSYFIVDDELPVVKEGDKLFDYAAARNFAASLASNDMCAMPDCDEAYTALDLDKIQEIIQNGNEQLEYHFVFSHFPDGTPNIQFMHSKFYNRRKMKWVGIVHEVLSGEAKRLYLDPSIIKLEHWQNPSEHRSRYLTGLALDCYMNPSNDRNSHYLGRELVWTGRPKSAVKELQRHIDMNAIFMERAQSMIFIGDAFMSMGQESEAIAWYHKAFQNDSSRRESLIRLAFHYWKKNEAQKTACYCAAALEIPENNFYANQAADYTFAPHELLYWAKWYMNDQAGSKQHWKICLKYKPEDPKYLHDARFYEPLPKVSIIIPTLGREEKLKRCLEAIKANANYPEDRYEVIVKQDSFENNIGVPKLLKLGVAESRGDMVMFLGNDCIPQPNFLILAVLRMLNEFPGNDGLIGLNDGQWGNNGPATHWLASKKLLSQLEGEFFCTKYHHVGVDNELTARCKKMNKYVWCEQSKVIHEHFASGAEMDEVYKLGWNEKNVAEDRALLAARAKILDFEIL
jgi:glycosyltransferase involved in cell wall biosynthesis